MNSPPNTPQIPVNRTLVGIMATVCCGIAGVMAVYKVEGSVALWQGAFLRVGIVLAAFWLALPTRTREAAWARVSIWTVAGVLLAVVALVRMPNRFLLPVAGLVGVALMVLRPWRKARPRQKLFD